MIRHLIMKYFPDKKIFLKCPNSLTALNIAPLHKRRNLLTLFKYGFFCFAFMILIYTLGEKKSESDTISCYDMDIEGGILDISDDKDNPPPKGKSIFFHETSCNSVLNWSLVINSRQACAVESAARMNPDYNVYLLYTSPIRFPNTTDGLLSRNDRILLELLKYDNIKIRRLDLRKYTKGTPLENWYMGRALQRSSYAVSHASDVLRYLSLWKYGGTYMDLDVVVMKSLKDIGYNFAGLESTRYVASGVLNFDPENFGHEVADLCAHELRNNFKGDEWGFNGPGVITRVLANICDSDDSSEWSPEACKGFNVLPETAFYPIYWKDWYLYFDPNNLVLALELVKKSFAIHVWNKNSINQNVYTDKNDVAYGYIARKYCPNVYRESGLIF